MTVASTLLRVIAGVLFLAAAFTALIVNSPFYFVVIAGLLGLFLFFSGVRHMKSSRSPTRLPR